MCNCTIISITEAEYKILRLRMKHENMTHAKAFSFISHLDFMGLIIKCHWDINCDFPQNLSVFFKTLSVKVTWKLPINYFWCRSATLESLCLKIQTQRFQLWWHSRAERLMGFQVQRNALCSNELQTYSKVRLGSEIACSRRNIYNNACT